MAKIMSDQIVLPKFIRDNLTFQEEEILLGMIRFAWEQGYEAGYNDGYEDCDSDD